MLDYFLFGLTAVLGVIILIYLASKKKMERRVEALEADIRRYAEVVARMADVQSKTFEKFSIRFEEIDERVLELSVPSQDPEMPLEKRHQVLSLAKRGVPLEEIVERVKAPVGEAELILNLRKFQQGLKGAPAPKQAEARVS